MARSTDPAAARLEAYRTRCEQYRRFGHDRVAAARFVAELVRKAPGPVLDVGTGKGLLAIELARTGRDVVSVDVDEDEQALAILLAREGGVADRIRFVCADAAHLSFLDGTFGCAAMMDVLHHLEQATPRAPAPQLATRASAVAGDLAWRLGVG